MKLVLLAALLAAQCTPAAPTPGPTPAPTPTVTTTPPPSVPEPADAGAANCMTAYARQFALGCPPAEDAHFGWVEIECPRLTVNQVSCVANAVSCVATRQCQER